jgi:hypothetical protein
MFALGVHPGNQLAGRLARYSNAAAGRDFNVNRRTFSESGATPALRNPRFHVR